MPFEPGISGNPSGRPNERPFRAALIRVLEKNGAHPNRLEAVASKLVSRAEQGDVTAIGMIADRLEGKAHQATTNETTYRLTVERVERQIIEPGRLLRTDELPKLIDIVAPPMPHDDSVDSTVNTINGLGDKDKR